jgi:hypothetical protein
MRERLILAASLAAAAVSLTGVSPAGADARFKSFPETISPDGAYILAWGATQEPAGNTEALTEAPYEDEAFDQANREKNISNYLVNVATHKVVATIPGFEYWAGPTWHKNRGGLEIAWSPNAQGGLAIFDGRWGSEGVAWIEPRTHKVVDAQKQLEKAFFQMLRKTEPTFKHGDVLFQEAAIPRPGLLMVKASATIPKERDTASYLMRFKITGEGANVQFRLLGSRKLPEESEPEDSDKEVELNKVYNQVRAKLPQKQREALRDEQARWLKLREAMSDERSRESFTQHRIWELRALRELDRP